MYRIRLLHSEPELEIERRQQERGTKQLRQFPQILGLVTQVVRLRMRHDEIQPKTKVIGASADGKPVDPSMGRDEPAVFRQRGLVRFGSAEPSRDSPAQEKRYSILEETGVRFMLKINRRAIRIECGESVSAPSRVGLEHVPHLEGAFQHARLSGRSEDGRCQISGALGIVEPAGGRGLRRRRFAEDERAAAEAMDVHVDRRVP